MSLERTTDQRFSLVRIADISENLTKENKTSPSCEGLVEFQFQNFFAQTSKLFAGLVNAKKKKKFLEV